MVLQWLHLEFLKHTSIQVFSILRVCTGPMRFLRPSYKKNVMHLGSISKTSVVLAFKKCQYAWKGVSWQPARLLVQAGSEAHPDHLQSSLWAALSLGQVTVSGSRSVPIWATCDLSPAGRSGDLKTWMTRSMHSAMLAACALTAPRQKANQYSRERNI